MHFVVLSPVSSELCVCLHVSLLLFTNTHEYISKNTHMNTSLSLSVCVYVFFIACWNTSLLIGQLGYLCVGCARKERRHGWQVFRKRQVDGHTAQKRQRCWAFPQEPWPAVVFLPFNCCGGTFATAWLWKKTKTIHWSAATLSRMLSCAFPVVLSCKDGAPSSMHCTWNLLRPLKHHTLLFVGCVCTLTWWWEVEWCAVSSFMQCRIGFAPDAGCWLCVNSHEVGGSGVPCSVV